MRVALIVEYDGTEYHGFQYQTNARSIQEELEKAVARFTGERVRVRAAGRTDAGVHATGQVVAFDTASNHGPDTIVQALNFYLPKDIAVRAAYHTNERFDPRRDALSRTYKYTMLNRAAPSPLTRRTACPVSAPLDVSKMNDAARRLIGTHDFARFAGPLQNPQGSTIRHIYKSSVTRAGEFVDFEVAGNAFMPHQVRRMAGSLVNVGRDNLSLDKFTMMVDGDNAGAVAPSLPPIGLCLMNVTYPDLTLRAGGSNGDKH